VEQQPFADDGASATIVRRAPFSDNPLVGARGLRTQQRILDAALGVFGDVGYERCSIERIAKAAGTGRASFYQYFSSKEDVFRQLAAKVDRQLRASTEALEPLTPDASGWTAIRGWVGRYATTYERFEPVFSTFASAVEKDAALAGGSARSGERVAALFQSKLAPTSLSPRRLEPIVGLLMPMVTRSLAFSRLLGGVVPGTYDEARVDDAITDVLHRALFGLDRDINARVEQHPPVARVPFGADVRRLLARQDIAAAHSIEDKPALGALLDAGHDVLIAKGYHGTRVDDIVAAAGVSRGAFYRYFENRDHLTQVLAARAMRSMSAVLDEMPSNGAAERNALRRWLRRYNAIHVGSAAITRTWIDGARQDPLLETGSAAVVDWGRRQMVANLHGRPYGDLELDGLVLLALLDVFAARPRSTPDLDGMTHIVSTALFDPRLHDGP
jgi:AcrR family transcriptional regulator